MSKQDEMQAAIIVKKVIKKGGGHHGGAWKVAYADFVTAMMAFFLLLWLLNVSTDEALEVISSYFDPSHPKVSDSSSGAGGVLGGLTMSAEGAMAEMNQQPVQPQSQGQKSNEQKTEATLQDMEEQLRAQEEARFQQAKAELEQALQSSEELRELAKHLQIDITPEGLRIQIIDQEGKPMFASGSARMLDKTKLLMNAVAGAIKALPNDVSIRGHTDSYKYAPGAPYTNWELSADRANAARRVLLEKGTDVNRLHDVMGKADREHLMTDNPLDARNRRISILLLRETVEHALERGAFDSEKPEIDTPPPPKEKANRYQDTPPVNDKPAGTFKKSPGEVYFP
ncbi:MAG: motility protein MotB [Alphaproteobacteria bacterium CG_4_9_14_3_um_filter_47_13]|nr:MAG: motility protein MotB [Alphaproteobacteria bacterium CG_4_9_14_3_um_filter_47_13]